MQLTDGEDRFLTGLSHTDAILSSSSLRETVWHQGRSEEASLLCLLSLCVLGVLGSVASFREVRQQDE